MCSSTGEGPALRPPGSDCTSLSLCTLITGGTMLLPTGLRGGLCRPGPCSLELGRGGVCGVGVEAIFSQTLPEPPQAQVQSSHLRVALEQGTSLGPRPHHLQRQPASQGGPPGCSVTARRAPADRPSSPPPVTAGVILLCSLHGSAPLLSRLSSPSPHALTPSPSAEGDCDCPHTAALPRRLWPSLGCGGRPPSPCPSWQVRLSPGMRWVLGCRVLLTGVCPPLTPLRKFLQGCVTHQDSSRRRLATLTFLYATQSRNHQPSPWHQTPSPGSERGR